VPVLPPGYFVQFLPPQKHIWGSLSGDAVHVAALFHCAHPPPSWLEYGLDGPMFEPRRARHSFSKTSAPAVVHPASCPPDTRDFFPEVKRPGRGVNRSFPCNAEATNERSYNTTPPIHLHSVARNYLVTTHVLYKTRSRASWTHYGTQSLTYSLAPEDGSRTGFRNATLRLIISQFTEYFWGVTPCHLVGGYRRFEVSPATRQWTAWRCRRRHHDASKLTNRHGVTSRETSMTSRIESKAISLCLLSHQQPWFRIHW
jgi:hypothetical protein